MAEINKQDLDIVLDMLDAAMEHSHWSTVLAELKEMGYSVEEIDRAHKLVSAVAGRDGGVL